MTTVAHTVTDDLSAALTYLDSAQRQLLAEAQSCDLNYRPPDGGWSAGQVLAHLIRTEKTMYLMFWLGLKSGASQSLLDAMDRLNSGLWKLNGMRFVSNGEEGPPELSKVSANYKGRFVAPAFLRPRQKQFHLEELLVERERVRARTLKLIASAPFARLAETQFSHPILGRFTLLEFVAFLGKHEEWHTEQIKRIKASRETHLK